MPDGERMRPQDAKVLKKFYNGRFRNYGYDPRSLGWIPGTQDIRFEVLTGIADLQGCSVLDVGCGFGDLYGYLYDREIDVDYTGVDMNPDFIDVARRIYPDAKFIVADFEDDDVDGNVDGKFDWSFESGIFNLRIRDNRSFIINTLKKMLKMSRRGLAADFLSSRAWFKDASMYYQDPGELSEHCRTLSCLPVVKSGYRAAEFCIYLYKYGSRE